MLCSGMLHRLKVYEITWVSDFRGYDTGDSRSMSDANAFAHRSKMNGHRNTIRDKRHVDGSEVDLVETTEVETTDYEKRGKLTV